MAAVDYKALFHYWIAERYRIMTMKDGGYPKPWSTDPVFQNTYFCNVHREDDRVTRWIRQNLSPKEVGLVNYEFVMVLARFLNWPLTLEYLKDPMIRARPGPEMASYAAEWCKILESWLLDLASDGTKIWGNAYVITSHGMKMSKIDYLCQHLLPDALRALPAIQAAARQIGYATPNEALEASKLVPSGYHAGTCSAVYMALQAVPGIGSFLAAQIVADLKNTKEHDLYSAPDKASFVAHGPGSIRGLSWYHYGSAEGVTERTFPVHFQTCREEFDANYDWGTDTPLPRPDSQDLQNCLCEFDKYCRVKNGTGRSKRRYAGI